MNDQLTFQDIPVDAWFFMDFAGMKDVLFEKTAVDQCRCRKINGEGYVTMPGKPMWEVKSSAQRQEEIDSSRRFREQRDRAGSVPGHSSTYPYGEH